MDVIKAWTPRDWMVVGGGVVAFIFSLFDYVGVSAGGYSASISAWHSYAILGLLLVFAVAIIWALRSFKVVELPTMNPPWEVILAAAAGLGTLLIIIRGVTYSSGFGGVNVGVGFGGIVLILAGVVVTAGAAWSFLLEKGKTPAA
jgi:hypothetical protein